MIGNFVGVFAEARGELPIHRHDRDARHREVKNGYRRKNVMENLENFVLLVFPIVAVQDLVFDAVGLNLVAFVEQTQSIPRIVNFRILSVDDERFFKVVGIIGTESGESSGGQGRR